MKGNSFTAVMGSDRPVSTTRIVYGAPKLKPTGLNWAAINPEPPTAEEAEAIHARAPKVRPKTTRPHVHRAQTMRGLRPKPNRAAIVADYQGGMTVPQIMAKRHHGQRTISSIIDAADIVRRDDRAGGNGTKIAATPELLGIIRDLYEVQGLTVGDVAEHTDYSTATIRRLMVEGGIAPRKAGQGQKLGSKNPRVNYMDMTKVIDLYRQGYSVPEVAALLNYPVTTTRRRMQASGEPIRDDRSTKTGGANRIDAYPDALVDSVSRLYLEEGLSKANTAKRLQTTPKIVAHVMTLHNIPARQGQSGCCDTLGPLRTRMETLGVTTPQLRAWANENGVPCPPRGVVSFAVIDAFEESA